MKNLLNTVTNFLRDEEGLTMVEYALAGALIAVVAIAGFSTLGGAVNDKASSIATEISTDRSGG